MRHTHRSLANVNLMDLIPDHMCIAGPVSGIDPRCVTAGAGGLAWDTGPYCCASCNHPVNFLMGVEVGILILSSIPISKFIPTYPARAAQCMGGEVLCRREEPDTLDSAHPGSLTYKAPHVQHL